MLAAFPLTNARDKRWWSHCHPYGRGSQLGIHVPVGVHLPIQRGTFEVSNRR